MITVRRAEYDDIPGIMKFMDEYWKPGNILAKDRSFFEWQFLDKDKLNMFIGIDDEADKVYGMLGVIIYNHSEHPDISGCTWQVIHSDNPVLALDLSNYMTKEIKPRYNRGTALTPKAVRLNRLLGNNIGTMDHYYRLADKKEYEIADIKRKEIPLVKDTGYSLKPICSVEKMKQIIPESELSKQLLSKDYVYIEKRYFNHPIYHYDVWKIVDEDEMSRSVLITREERVGNNKTCKIIDHYGEMRDLGKITVALDCLMKEKGYEYVDVYSYGVPIDIYEQAGFCCCDENSENIIPNYFHPFVKKNITLKLVDNMVEGLRLFRGDGDQDRPC